MLVVLLLVTTICAYLIPLGVIANSKRTRGHEKKLLAYGNPYFFMGCLTALRHRCTTLSQTNAKTSAQAG
ncbi:hypothetical protein [Pseudoalteromonas xiamenensis]|uniref:hypothetical protein n=1 Tax=Pseudoalteromonas xiamenensis TaxID=882626 RepID=UPI001FCC6166|nr:hypothetical protein [Pseudoalteromonas xiamenensis]